MEHLCDTVRLVKNYGGVRAVDDFSFFINPGEVVAIIGPNGAGKTTVFNLLSGVEKAEAGEITFRGKVINRKSPFQIACLGMARTFQNLQVFGHMTVLENVMVGAHSLGQSGLFNAAIRIPGIRAEEKKLEEQAWRQIERVGISSKEARLPAGMLPYGRQRLLEISRALAMNPYLLLLDEPAAGLNAGETEQVMDLIGSLRGDGLAVLLVEHDMDLVMGVADRVIVLEHGQKIAEGNPAAVQKNPRVIAAYLGEEVG